MIRPGHGSIGLLFPLLLIGCDRRERPADAPDLREQNRGARTRVEEQLGDVPTALDTASAVRLSAAFRAAAAHALPGVVRITTVAVESMPFHPGGELGPQWMQGSGSGFVIDQRGYILTNHHVVQNAQNVNVALLDGREYTAEVVGADPSTDVAVIRVSPGSDTLPAIQLGDSEQLRVGDWVIALGNPLGLTFTATAGIVSAKNRSINILDPENRSTALEAFIQTDAAINPGNSGGPLIDLNGRVIGINTAIQSETGFFTGAGFAIPITLARKVAQDLIDHGEVHRPRLGISIQDVSAADAEVYGLSAVRGVEVTSVTPGESADRAGIQFGDVIVAIDGNSVNTLTELQSRVALFQPGDRIALDFIRYGKPMKTTVELGQFESRGRPARERPARSANPLGFTFTALPPALARRMRLQGDDLPVVTRVDPLGPARGAGLAEGHVVRRFNNREIRTIRDLERAAASVTAGQVVSLIVLNAREPQPVPTIINYRIQ